MGITTKVEFKVYSGEAYDEALTVARSSPGWEYMWIDDIEAWAEGDPLGEMTAFFDTEVHAMLFRLKIGV